MRAPDGEPPVSIGPDAVRAELKSTGTSGLLERSGVAWHRNSAALRKLADSNLTFLLVAIPVAYAFFLVPQISNIWMYVPYEAVSSAPLQAGPFILFVAGTLGFFLFAWRQLLPRQLTDGASDLAPLWSAGVMTIGAILIALPQLYDLRERILSISQNAWADRWYFVLTFVTVFFLVLLAQGRISAGERFAKWYRAQWQTSAARKVIGLTVFPLFALYFVVIHVLSVIKWLLQVYISVCWSLADFAGRWLLVANGFPSRVDDAPPRPDYVGARISIGILSFILGGVILFVSPRPSSDEWADATALPLRSLSFWLLLFGGWMIIVSGVQKYQRLWPVLAMAARWLSVAGAGYVVAEVIWLLAEQTVLGISYRAYTDWAIFLIAFLILGFASFIDATHQLTDSPVRIVAAVALIGYFVWLPAGRAPLNPLPVLVAEGESEEVHEQPDWLDHFTSRIEELPREGPAIFISASGGGARAAAFTVLVFEALEREGMIDDSGEPTPNSWSDHVVLVSGVSGGSLGAAYAIRHRPLVDARKISGDEYEFTPLRNSFESQHSRHVRNQALQVVDFYADDLKKLNSSDEFGVILEQGELSDLVKEWSYSILSTRACRRPSDHFPVYSEHVDRMFTDLMAPVFRGVLTPTVDRSTSLASFWKDGLQFGESTNLDGYERGDETTWKNAPLAVFNATEVIRGTRFVVGFPPLPPRFLSSDPKGERTPYDTTALADFSNNYCMGLSDAVRLSASFPVGMPVSRLRDGDKTIDLLDGGVNDNTGISTIGDILLGVRRASEDASNTETQKKAIAILRELRRRGIIFIEVDSGAKPSQAPRGELATPGQALSNATMALAESGKYQSKRQFVELLSPLFVGHEETIRKAKEGRVSLLSDLQIRSKAEAEFALAERAMTDLKREPIYYISFTCNHSNEKDVMTAWSLGPLDKARIVGTFHIEKLLWQRKNANLLKAWLSNRKRVNDYFVELGGEISRIQVAESATKILNATAGAAASAAGWATVPEVSEEAVGYLIEKASGTFKVMAAAKDATSIEEFHDRAQASADFVDKWIGREFKRVAPVQKSEQSRVTRMKGIMAGASGP